MRLIELLDYGKFFHIYNRGTDSCELFTENVNFEYFLHLYDKYISPVADTYAWVLMRNHFHLLVRIKEEVEIGFLSEYFPSAVAYPDAGYGNSTSKGSLSGNCSISNTLSGLKPTERVNNADRGLSSKKYNPSHQFSHLFNAYAQAFNKRYGRTGSLFEHPFKRKIVTESCYFKNIVIYIHNNPVHHKITEYAKDYPWSSYLTLISYNPTHLQRDVVMGWFDNETDFKTAHNFPGDITDLEKWLGLY